MLNLKNDFAISLLCIFPHTGAACKIGFHSSERLKNICPHYETLVDALCKFLLSSFIHFRFDLRSIGGVLRKNDLL